MRMCKRNKQTVWYANYVSMTDAVDGDGNRNGEKVKIYTTPVKVELNVKSVSSDSEVEIFGVHAIDTIKIVSEKDLPITGTSIVWFDSTPPSPYTPTAPEHNYTIAGIPPTLNDFVFYARKVDVT